MSAPTTRELLMRVLRAESSGLFDGSGGEPVEVIGWDYREYCPAVCDTCGDWPETLTVEYRARDGSTGHEIYEDFGLAEMLDVLDGRGEKS